MPDVSVVIPLYNKESHIERALNSVLSQTIQDFEIIVVDDGSTDRGAEFVRSFDDPRIRFIQQENRGVSAARNRGIETAEGELIAFLDADDEWLPGFLETILRLREKYPEAGAYATAYYIQYCRHIQEADIQYLPSKPWEGIIPRFFQSAANSGPLTSSSVCIHKTTFNKIGPFIVGEWWGEDTEMWGRIALHYQIAFSWDFGAVYHYGATNRANERIKMVTDHPFIKTGLEYLKSNAGNISPGDLDDLQEYIELQKLKVAGRALKSGNPKYARKILRECQTKRHRNVMNQIFLISYLPPRLYILLRGFKRRIR